MMMILTFTSQVNQVRSSKVRDIGSWFLRYRLLLAAIRYKLPWHFERMKEQNLSAPS